MAWASALTPRYADHDLEGWMDRLHHGGQLWSASSIGAAVASAVGGRVPRPPKGKAPTDDPVVWLTGLIHASRGTDLWTEVVRAFELAAGSGGARQLEVISAIVAVHDVVSVGTLLAALERPSVWRDAGLARAIAGSIVRQVRAGAPYPQELRGWAAEPKLRGVVVGVVLEVDTAWALEHLGAMVAATPEAAGEQVRELLARSVDTGLRDLLVQRLGGLEPVAARALRLAMGLKDPEPNPQASAGPSIAGEPAAPAVEQQALEPAPSSPALDVRRLPWRGEDGRWFDIPEGTTLPVGPYALRRGWHLWKVERGAAARFRIEPREAAMRRSEQLAALFAVGRRWLGDVAGVDVPADPGGGVEPVRLVDEPELRLEAARRIDAFRARLRRALKDAD